MVERVEVVLPSCDAAATSEEDEAEEEEEQPLTGFIARGTRVDAGQCVFLSRGRYIARVSRIVRGRRALVLHGVWVYRSCDLDRTRLCDALGGRAPGDREVFLSRAPCVAAAAHVVGKCTVAPSVGGPRRGRAWPDHFFFRGVIDPRTYKYAELRPEDPVHSESFYLPQPQPQQPQQAKKKRERPEESRSAGTPEKKRKPPADDGEDEEEEEDEDEDEEEEKVVWVREEHRRGATFKWLGKPARMDSGPDGSNALMEVYPGGFARSGVLFKVGDFVYAPNPDARRHKLDKQPQPQIGVILLAFLDRETDTPTVRLEWFARPTQKTLDSYFQKQQQQQPQPQDLQLYRTIETSDVPIDAVRDKCTVLHFQDAATPMRMSLRTFWWSSFLDTHTGKVSSSRPERAAKQKSAASASSSSQTPSHSSSSSKKRKSHH